MNDRRKIIAGLAVFILLVTFPLWFNLTTEMSPAPVLELPDDKFKQCVLPNDTMVSEHMKLLDLWRHSVVRNGERIFVSQDSLNYDMSLSNTCLDCHSSKANFCDRCHDYVSVKPYCWDCHIDDPKGEKK